MTGEARQHVCPDCQRSMTIEEQTGLRLVKMGSPTPPAPCCQKSASDGYTVVTAFSTPGA